MGRRSDHTRDELEELILNATRDSIREGGIMSISSRKIAKRVGYTVGTVFQVFGSMDQLVARVNIETLDALGNALDTVDMDGPVEPRLRALAGAFLDFADVHQREWDAVISYQYSSDQTGTDAYRARIDRLLTRIFTATADLYGPGEDALQDDHVRLLWTSLYGIFVLSAAHRLTEGYDKARMVDALIELYLGERRAARG